MTPKQTQDYKNLIIANINSNMSHCPTCRDKTLDMVHAIFNEIYNLQTKIKEEQQKK